MSDRQYRCRRPAHPAHRPLGHVSRYAYNGEGQLIRQIDPLGHSLGYRYDAAMRLIALGNQNGEQSDFVYDAQDNLVRDGDDARALCKNLQPADSAARTRPSFSR